MNILMGALRGAKSVYRSWGVKMHLGKRFCDNNTNSDYYEIFDSPHNLGHAVLLLCYV